MDIYASKGWKDSCADSGQTFTYSGVNAHFQTGVAERHIQTLQEIARTCLIHSQHRWKEAITPNLWPYAIRAANNVYNESPTKGSKRPPCQVFSGSRVKIRPRGMDAFRLSCLCSRQCATKPHANQREMETSEQSWSLLGQVPIACSFNRFGAQFADWTSVPTVPCPVRSDFSDNEGILRRSESRFQVAKHLRVRLHGRWPSQRELTADVPEWLPEQATFEIPANLPGLPTAEFRSLMMMPSLFQRLEVWKKKAFLLQMTRHCDVPTE